MIDGFRITILTSIFPNPRWAIMYSLNCNLHGFHVYKEVWSPIAGSNWNAATREITVTIAMLLQQPITFWAVLPTLQLVTSPERFPEQHAFSYFVLKSSTRTTEDLPWCKDDCKLLYKLQLRLILPKGTRQYLKSINRLLFQVTKNPG